MDTPTPELKPLPSALYSCKHCREECSWPAEDLFWSTPESAWVCTECWDTSEEDKGVSLAQEMASRATSTPPVLGTISDTAKQAAELLTRTGLEPYDMEDTASIIQHAITAATAERDQRIVELVAALELASLNVRNREDYSTKLESSRIEIAQERDSLCNQVAELTRNFKNSREIAQKYEDRYFGANTLRETIADLTSRVTEAERRAVDREARNVELRQTIVELQKFIDNMRFQLEEARREAGQDTERLGWLEANRKSLHFYEVIEPDQGHWFITAIVYGAFTARKAIDAARHASTPSGDGTTKEEK